MAYYTPPTLTPTLSSASSSSSSSTTSSPTSSPLFAPRLNSADSTPPTPAGSSSDKQLAVPVTSDGHCNMSDGVTNRKPALHCSLSTSDAADDELAQGMTRAVSLTDDGGDKDDGDQLVTPTAGTSAASFNGNGVASSPPRPANMHSSTAPDVLGPSPSPPAVAAAATSPTTPTLSQQRSPAGVPPPLYPRQSAPSSMPPRQRPTPAAASGGLRAGVRGAPLGAGGIKLPPSLAAKMAAMTSGSRGSTPSPPATASGSSPGTGPGSSAAAAAATSPLRAPPPPPTSAGPSIGPGAVPGRTSAAGPPPPTMPRFGGPVAGRGGGMMARRRAGPGLTLSGMGVNAEQTRREGEGAGLRSGPQGAQDRSVVGSPGDRRETGGTPFSNFRKIVDPSGRLNFASKAVLHSDGVDFSSGASFKVKMDDFELFEELGKGNYGTVQKVWHKPTKVTMALKEIRLELDDSKLKTIITELDILHRATSPYIIDFYGAFFIESCVYYCMEFMDAGSLQEAEGFEVPEDVLARTTRCVVAGLKFLKDELKIMHRDVKPTNILLNCKGEVKLCDFGVSGQLDRSLAKTNIGCQSYMAPERIKGESQGVASSYTASSDVWSLGLSIIEFAIGHYPYPPETYSNVFAQLTAIVHGDPPSLPMEYSEVARDFVAGCLEKVASRRPTYAQLLEHPFLKQDLERDVDMCGWITRMREWREKNPRTNTPALA